MSALILIENLTHRYGRFTALRDVSLDVEHGAIGLVGQNGAGKTTLMQILLGLCRPTLGQATVLGLDVAQAGPELRRRIGYMPERDSFVPGLSGFEFVSLAGELCGMYRKYAMRRAHEALSFLELGESRYRKIETYSVGMKQRLKLAAALVHEPDLLLLDEPTSGLDPDGRAAMLELLQCLGRRSGKSLLLSTHLLGDIERVCDSTIILDQGRVLGQGNIAELRNRQAQCYNIRRRGERDEFLSALTAEGVTAEANGSDDGAKIFLPNEVGTQIVFDVAAKVDCPILSLLPEEEELEDVYHRLISAGTTDESVTQ